MMAFNRSDADQHFWQRNTAPLDPSLASGARIPPAVTTPSRLLLSQHQQFGNNNNQFFYSAPTSPVLPIDLQDLSSLRTRILAQNVLAARLRAAQQARELENFLLREVQQPMNVHNILRTSDYARPPERSFSNMMPGTAADASQITRVASLPSLSMSPLQSLDLLRSTSLGFSNNDTFPRLKTPNSAEVQPVANASRAGTELQDEHNNLHSSHSTSNDNNSVSSCIDGSNHVKSESKVPARIYIDEIAEWDVLCGRGGRSNHHPGNKRYRNVVSETKAMYRTTEAKTLKTDLSRAIVDHVCNYGGRFVKKDEKAGKYYVLTKADARLKTSQALRETKTLKWTL